MGSQEFLSFLGLGDLIADDFFAMQIGVLFLTTLLFLGSFILCLQAFRAAGAARRAMSEITDDMSAVAKMTSEARQLSDRIDDAISRQEDQAARYLDEAADAEPMDAQTRDDTPPAEVMELGESDEAPLEKEQNLRAENPLEAAKRAATVPSALLKGILRRR